MTEKFTLEFARKLDAVRIAMALESAAEDADPGSHKIYLTLLASVRAQLGMSEPERCQCDACSGSEWQERVR